MRPEVSVDVRPPAAVQRAVLALAARHLLPLVSSLLLTGACVTAESGAPATSKPAAADAVASPASGGKAEVGPLERQRHTVEVEGHPIAVWAKVPRDPWGSIVLVHGRTWSAIPDFDLQVPGESRSLMDALAAEGLAVYAVDQRGYGGTPRDNTQWLTPDRAVADLAAVLSWTREQHASLPAPMLLGWSLGSLVSQVTAQRHPAALSALVLYGYPRSPDQSYPQGPGPEVKPDKKATTAAAAAEDFIIPGSISRAAIDAFVEAALAADPVRMDWRGTEQWNALDPAAVTTPTLLIHGERDPYAPIEAQAKLFARLGHADRAWVIVAGGDHAAHLENSGPRFVHAVVGFMRRPGA